MIGTLMAVVVSILAAHYRPSEASFFRRLSAGGLNFCARPAPILDPPVKTWDWTAASFPPVRSKNIECSLLCLRDPACVLHQVVKTDTGSGCCHAFTKTLGVDLVNGSVCRGFAKSEKAFNCIIRWNPDNFNTKFNKDGFRVEKLDKSWTTYNDSRGIHAIEMEATTCSPSKHHVFDTMTGAAQQKRFQAYLNNLTSGLFLIGYSVGEFMDKNMIAFLFNNFKISYDPKFTYSLAFICQKNGQFKCVGQTTWIAQGYTILLGISRNEPLLALSPTGKQFMNYYLNSI